MEFNKKRKVVFLDVDGVLNSYGTIERIPGTFYVGIDDKLVSNLASIINAFHSGEVDIVLSSSWRRYLNTDYIGPYLIQKLSEHNLKYSDVTGRDENGDRGKEIKQYIKDHPEITDYVILDDEFGRSFKYAGIESHYVQTNYGTGLTSEDVKLAISILGGNLRSALSIDSEPNIEHKGIAL